MRRRARSISVLRASKRSSGEREYSGIGGGIELIMHRTAGRRPLPPIFVLALAIAAPLGCGGPQRAGSSGTTAAPGAVGSGRQSPAEPPAAPSLEIGLQLFRKGDFKGAEPHLAGALRQSPGDRRILEALGAIYAR